MHHAFETSERLSIFVVREVSLSERKHSDLILKLECLGFLTLNARRKDPNRILLFGAEALETMFSEVAVPPRIIAVAREIYDWEFRALISDLASGHFFQHLQWNYAAFDWSQARRYGPHSSRRFGSRGRPHNEGKSLAEKHGRVASSLVERRVS